MTLRTRRDRLSSNLAGDRWRNWIHICFSSFVSWCNIYHSWIFSNLRCSWRIEYSSVELVFKRHSICWYVTYVNNLQSIIEQTTSTISLVIAVRGRLDRWTSKTFNFSRSCSWHQLRTVRFEGASFRRLQLNGHDSSTVKMTDSSWK